jgi:hypothetical protein
MPFFSPSDIYASALNKASTFTVTSVTNQTQIDFKAFDLDFSDSFTSNWASTPVFGRMDPIHIFKNTTRSLSFRFNLFSDNFNEAHWNVEKIGLLALAMYPIYKNMGDEDGQAHLFDEVPLVTVKWSMINGQLGAQVVDEEGKPTGGSVFGQADTPPRGGTATEEKEEKIFSDFRGPQRGRDYTSINIEDGKGLPGFISNLQINPISSMGYHHIKRENDKVSTVIGTNFSPMKQDSEPDVFIEKIIKSAGGDTILPKGFGISFSFTPVHHQAIGLWNPGASPQPRTNAFPYSVGMDTTMKQMFYDETNKVNLHEAMGYHGVVTQNAKKEVTGGPGISADRTKSLSDSAIEPE